MSAIYGAEHLLRMLGVCFLSLLRHCAIIDISIAVSLPQMVATSTMDPESVSLVRDYVNELLLCVLALRPFGLCADFLAGGWYRNGTGCSFVNTKALLSSTKTFLGRNHPPLHRFLSVRKWPQDVTCRDQRHGGRV
jgi:hypothetical protein